MQAVCGCANEPYQLAQQGLICDAPLTLSRCAAVYEYYRSPHTSRQECCTNVSTNSTWHTTNRPQTGHRWGSEVVVGVGIDATLVVHKSRLLWRCSACFLSVCESVEQYYVCQTQRKTEPATRAECNLHIRVVRCCSSCGAQARVRVVPADSCRTKGSQKEESWLMDMFIWRVDGAVVMLRLDTYCTLVLS